MHLIDKKDFKINVFSYNFEDEYDCYINKRKTGQPPLRPV